MQEILHSRAQSQTWTDVHEILTIGAQIKGYATLKFLGSLGRNPCAKLPFYF